MIQQQQQPIVNFHIIDRKENKKYGSGNEIHQLQSQLANYFPFRSTRSPPLEGNHRRRASFCEGGGQISLLVLTAQVLIIDKDPHLAFFFLPLFVVPLNFLRTESKMSKRSSRQKQCQPAPQGGNSFREPHPEQPPGKAKCDVGRKSIIDWLSIFPSIGSSLFLPSGPDPA